MVKNKRLFITGIPTAGKSYLGNKLAKEIGGIKISFDHIRSKLTKDRRYKKWVHFYADQKDERAYYTTTDPDQQWENLIRQSEKLWPGFLEEIKKYEQENRPIIFEGVNILPHLAKKDFVFPGVVLIGRSFEDVFERNKFEPRWGKTEELQRLEAKSFFYVERPRYKIEAEKYNYQIFETAADAYSKALELLK